MKNEDEAIKILELLLGDVMMARALALSGQEKIDLPLLRSLLVTGIEIEEGIASYEDERAVEVERERERVQQLVAAGKAHNCGDRLCRHCPVDSDGLALMVLAELCGLEKQICEMPNRTKRMTVSLPRRALVAMAWIDSIATRRIGDALSGSAEDALELDAPATLAAARRYIGYALAAQLEHDFDQLHKRSHPLMQAVEPFDEAEIPF